MKRSQEQKVKPYVSKRLKAKDNDKVSTTAIQSWCCDLKSKAKQQYQHTKAITRIQWHPSLDTNTIASSSLDGQIIIWNSSAKDSSIKSNQCFNGHTEAVKDLKWSRDGMSLLTASFDKTCKILDSNTGTQWIF